MVDSGFGLPAVAAGDMDILTSVCGASLFNIIAKGAPVRFFMDRGRETPGMGSQAILASPAMHAAGFSSAAGYRHLKGKTIATSVRGKVAHYLHLRGLRAAGLDADDVEWQWGMESDVAVKLMNSGKIDATLMPLPGAYAAERNGVARIATWSDEIEPHMQLACFAANEKSLRERSSAFVRFAMAMMQGNREFMAAAKTGDPVVLKILADGTRLPAALIDQTRPRWTDMALDGLPNIANVMAQQRFWQENTDFLPKTVDEDRLFDLRVVAEARRRLGENNPFAA